MPVFANENHEKDASQTIQNVLQYVCTQQTKAAASEVVSKQITITYRRALFPSAACFFVKIDKEGKDNLVLAADGDAPNSRLVIRKLSFADFRKQLWTFQDGHLVNYGNQCVIGIQGKHVTLAPRREISSPMPS